MEDSTPLKGLTFLNTRDAQSAHALTDLLVVQGGRVVECPTFALLPPTSWKPFDRRLESVTQKDWIVFTSANAVRAAVERVWELNKPLGALGQARIGVIGQATANAVLEAGLKVDLMPGSSQAENLLEVLLSEVSRGDRVWIPRAQEAREVLAEGLRAAGAAVDVTPVYRSGIPPAGLQPARADLLAGRIDWLLFTSSSTINHFFEMLDADLAARLENHWPHVACIGAVTAETARTQGLHVHVVPTRQDTSGLVDALVAHLAGPNSPKG